MLVAEPGEQGVTDFRLTGEARLFRNGSQRPLENPPNVFGDGKIHVGRIGGCEVDSAWFQARKQPFEFYSHELLVQPGNRLGWQDGR